jgi:hypothetical protein
MISDKPGVRQDKELESHLNKGLFVVESPFAGFVPLQFCFFFFNLAFISTIKGPYKANIRAEIANIPAAIVMANARNGLIPWREKRLEMALIQISVPAREN